MRHTIKLTHVRGVCAVLLAIAIALSGAVQAACEPVHLLGCTCSACVAAHEDAITVVVPTPTIKIKGSDGNYYALEAYQENLCEACSNLVVLPQQESAYAFLVSQTTKSYALPSWKAAYALPIGGVQQLMAQTS